MSEFPELQTAMLETSKLLDAALDFLKRSTQDYAKAERAYREEKARQWVTTTTGTVAEREAYVNGATAALREQRDVADGMRQAALEAVRSRRAQLSALQTLANANREEAAFARTGPA